MFNRRLILCSTLSGVLPCAVARAQQAQPGWTLCTRTLELIDAHLRSADESRIVAADEMGIEKRYPIGELFFALRRGGLDAPEAPEPDQQPDQQSEPQSGVRFITLADGQTIAGSIERSADPDMLAATLSAGGAGRGPALIPLERVLLISDDPALDWSTLGHESDSIVTASGDRIPGFIESVGPSVSITGDHGTTRIDLDQIRSMALANIPARIEGAYISTSDHLRLRATAFDLDPARPASITIDSGSLGLSPSTRPTWMLDPGAPIAIEMIDAHRRVLSLASIPPELVEATGGRGWAPAPAVVLASDHPVLSTIDLRSPVRVVYTIPEGSTRLACELVATINTWTDCVARVHSIAYDGTRTELLSQRLNAEHPSEPLNVALEKGTEKIEFLIDPGAYGPIQDRVLIKRPRVLVETP